jgi:hypothetical protein
MSARDGDHGTRGINARPRDDPLIDSAFETKRRPPQVANGREPAHEGISGLGTGK